MPGPVRARKCRGPHPLGEKRASPCAQRSRVPQSSIVCGGRVLAREIAGPDANDEIRERACQFAEAQIDLCRIRSARLQLLSRALADPEYYSRVNDRKIVLPRLLREDILLAADFVEPKTTGPEGLEKLEDRYFGPRGQTTASNGPLLARALSRRKFAIRALDDARRLDDAGLRRDRHRIEGRGSWRSRWR